MSKLILSQDNKLLASAAFLVAEMIGVGTRQKSKKSRKGPYWKRCMYIHLSKLEEV